MTVIIIASGFAASAVAGFCAGYLTAHRKRKARPQ